VIFVTLALLAMPPLQSRVQSAGSSVQDDRILQDDRREQDATSYGTAAQSNAKSSDNERPGGTATSSAGQAGLRRTREQVAQSAGIEPMARIASRIQNRAQTRIRNRLDRYYDPQANVISPFLVAGDQARTAGRRRR